MDLLLYQFLGGSLNHLNHTIHILTSVHGVQDLHFNKHASDWNWRTAILQCGGHLKLNLTQTKPCRTIGRMKRSKKRPASEGGAWRQRWTRPKHPYKARREGQGRALRGGGESLPSTRHVVELSSPTGAWRSRWRSHSFCAHRWHLGYTHPWFRCYQSHRNFASALIRTHTSP